MEIFVINLERCAERLANCERQFKSLGLAFHRFPAVDGRALDPQYKNKVCSRIRWLFANGRYPFDGEIGCALSHYGTYRQVQDEGLEYACIVEDDIVLFKNFPERLEAVEKWLKNVKEPRVVFLFCHNKEVENIQEKAIIPANRGHYAETYVLNIAAA